MSQFERVTNGNSDLGVNDGTGKGLIIVSERVVSEAKSLSAVNFGQLENSMMYNIKLDKEDLTGGFNKKGALSKNNSNAKDGDNKKADFKISKPKDKFTSHVGFNLLHGIYMEFGTRHIKPQPALRPALDIVVNGTDALKVLAKIQAEEMLGALKKGQKRETFNV